MGMASTGAVIEREASSANGKRAKGVLQGVIQPDQPLPIGANARCMRTPTAARGGIEVFSYALICAWLSGGHVQHSNSADPAFGPPDIAVRVNGNQMWSQAGAACWRVAYFIFF